MTLRAHRHPILSTLEQVPGVIVLGQEKFAMSGQATNAPPS